MNAHSLTHCVAIGAATLLLAARSSGQGQGQWLPPFGHQHNSPPVATNALAPFTTTSSLATWPASFNAIHMAVVPVGVHRGRVLVFDLSNVAFPATPFHNATGGGIGEVRFDVKLDKVVLIAPGSTTHSSDMHQRYVECAVTALSQTQLTFNAPSERQAPRGYYMMFVLSAAVIPSEAIWVRLA